MYTHTCVCVCICIYVNKYIYMNIYIHTHRFSFTPHTSPVIGTLSVVILDKKTKTPGNFAKLI